MAENLTLYQKTIISRLEKGGVLYRSRLGMYTGAYHFRGSHKDGINSASIDKLLRAKIVRHSDEMTMNGVIEFVHLPGQEPWKKLSEWVQYQDWRRKK